MKSRSPCARRLASFRTRAVVVVDEGLREGLWDLFVEFKKSCRLLKVKINDEHEPRFALLTFSKAEDVEKALAFVASKSLHGTRLKAELYDGVTNGTPRSIDLSRTATLAVLENEEFDAMKRSVCSEPDIDEYSVRATRTLYIGNLQSEISYNELRETYSAYGDIIVRSVTPTSGPCRTGLVFARVGIGNQATDANAASTPVRLRPVRRYQECGESHALTRRQNQPRSFDQSTSECFCRVAHLFAGTGLN